MDKKYFGLLYNQFKAAFSIKDSEDFSHVKDDFFKWLYMNQRMGEYYFSFIQSLGDHILVNGFETCEVMKGKYDNIGLSSDITLVTPFGGGLEDSEKVVSSLFAIYDGVPHIYSYKNQKFQMINLSDLGINNFITQNPYDASYINKFEQICNSRTGNIIVGVYGDLSDNNYSDKIQMLKDFRDKLSCCYTEDYVTSDNCYYYAVSSYVRQLNHGR